MNKQLLVFAALALMTVHFTASARNVRDNIVIVGSSTVYPFTTVVAEQFGRMTRFRAPIVEATGSGGGLKLFCAGVGVRHPDIANSSRRIKSSEFADCQKNGVSSIVEVKVGYDGITIARSNRGKAFDLTLKQLFLALAKEVPDPDGSEKTVPNPYTNWRQIDPSLPDSAIEVMGPPPTSGTRDAFVELAMEGGCQAFPFIKALKDSNESAYRTMCHSIREDGAYVEAGENDNLIVQKLDTNPNALGIFGFSFLDQNTDRLFGLKIDGVEPDFDEIASGAYPVSRSMYIYVKKAHVPMIPGLKEFLEEFTSEKAWGEEGYLTDKGLIPMPVDERKRFADDVRNLKELEL
ncbi:PstS family phosphate ABC transporter substrate-binding protein [Methylotuvimicrobium alcaliphilum]|uniref:ABC transporter component putative periplasmic phosphate-binding protein n=1 Tax=Methylotuvimicrobium alcaliphilum (strain DSM 19304 / NCIMB 14124 / VKM B-2133 / 20Z) TaxID=1091494 RepID=G4T2A7_META2|nr:PstS family phosphate ABC transporter substrate-binding protein [Methylotuvimicrobium alcaliphilum]CCE23547.1 ABC transporter component; putative periplasmic phosphate-binding protein [Methylotuvimicrobium alcaliphilum 20Z]